MGFIWLLREIKNYLTLSNSCNLLASTRNSFLEPVHKRPLIQSQVARIILFTRNFQFIFNIPNHDNYLNLKVQPCNLENHIRVITLT